MAGTSSTVPSGKNTFCRKYKKSARKRHVSASELLNVGVGDNMEIDAHCGKKCQRLMSECLGHKKKSKMSDSEVVGVLKDLVVAGEQFHLAT